jgi:hypothetical protein
MEVKPTQGAQGAGGSTGAARRSSLRPAGGHWRRARAEEGEEEMIAISDRSSMIGRRVQTQPPSDAWMSGDRFGAIVKVGWKFVHVRMERSGRVLKFLIYPAGDFDPIVPDLLNADGTGLALTPPRPTGRATRSVTGPAGTIEYPR